MKWIGQHIWDFYSRFRNDVYLESLTTTTDTSVLVVDSNNKVCKNTTTLGGDITSVVAGVGLSGGATSGAATVTVDFSEFSDVTPANGDKLATLDSDGANEQLTTVASLATLYAGTGLTAASSVINIDAAQSGITSLGTLTALDVDSINLNDKTITITGDTSDTFTIVTGAAGATTFATVDTAGGDGDMTFNPDGAFYVNSDDVRFISDQAHDPLVQIRGEADDATGPRLRFTKTRGTDGQDSDVCGTVQFYSYDDGTPSTQNYAQIQTTIHDATSGQESGKLALGVANHDGGVENGLVLTGGSVDAEVDVTIGNGAASVTNIAGDLTVTGSDLTFDSVALTALQTSEEPFVDNDTSIMTSAAIDDRINKKSIRVYGNTIKILFQDFMANDDIGVTKTVQFKDDGTTGLKAGHDNIELYAFIDIPEGKKATDVIIYGTPETVAVDVFEMDVDASGLGSTLGTGTIGTSLDFTDVDSTATNFLAIKVTTTSFTGDRVYGGLLTIADIA